MAYSVTTYTDVHDVLTKFHNFATTYGWTSDRFTAGSGETTRGESFIHKGASDYYSFESEIDTKTAYRHGVNASVENQIISGCGNTGYNTNNYFNQPGSSNLEVGRICKTNFITGTGPRKLWLFTDGNPGNYIHMVINSYQNEYRHIHIGELDKSNSGTYNGGRYLDMQWWDEDSSYLIPDDASHNYPFDSRRSVSGSFGSVIHAEVDSRYWHLIYDSTSSQYARGSMRDDVVLPLQNLELTRSMLTMMYNIVIRTNRNSGLFNILGTVRDIRSVDMSFYDPEYEISLADGSDWILFPVAGKNPLQQSGYDNSGMYGLAYRTDV